MAFTRRFFSFVLVCSMLIFGAVFSRAETADPLPQAARSIVQLYAIGYSEDGEPLSRWTGSGFAVGIAGEDSDTFLTNCHVVTGNGEYPTDRVRIWILRSGAELPALREPLQAQSIECIVLSASSDYPDLAVIRMLEPVPGYPALPLMQGSRVAFGTPVYALGYPRLTGSGVSAGDAVVTTGTLSQYIAMKNAGGARCLIHSAQIRPGNSGGPLLDARGVAIGVNAYGFEPSLTTELFCSVDIDYAIALLESLDIPCTIADGPSRLTVAVTNFLHTAGVGTAAASAGILILLFAVLKKYFRHAA